MEGNILTGAMVRILEGASSTLASLLDNSSQQTEYQAGQADALDRIADCMTVVTIRASVADMAPEDQKRASEVMDIAMARILESDDEEEADED